MLEQMRKQSQSAIVLLLFGFIIFVFVFSFGAGSVGFRKGGCGSANLAAVVNEEEITATDFQYYYDQALRNAIQQRKGNEPLRQEDKFQIANEVLESMINRAILIQSAQRLGLHVTDDERNESIKKAFSGDDGRFDFDRYKFYITRYLKTSPTIFEESWRERMLAERMADVIQDTTRVAEDELLNAYLTRETKINLQFTKISPEAYKAGVELTDEEVSTFLDKSFERVQDFYDSHDSRYHKPKKVQVAHVHYIVRVEYDTEQVKDKREQAELTVDDLKKGSKFEDQAKQYSEDSDTKDKGGKLPMLTREALAARWGTPFAEAAFKLEKGEFSGVVKSDKGFHVIQCQEIIEAEDHPIEEVKEDIARAILLSDRAEAAARSEAERILAGLREGKKFEELVPEPAGEEPNPFAPRVASTGIFSRMGGFLPRIGVDEDLVRAAFELTMDKPVPDQVFETSSPLGQKAFVVMKLVERQEADMEKFAEAKEALRNQLLQQRRARQLNAWLENKRKSSNIEKNPALLTAITQPALRRRQQQ